MKRVLLRVSGPAIQHVGYRDAVENIAAQLLIVGTIDNLRDGRVEIVCEGEEDNLKRFIQQIQIREKQGKPFLPRIWVDSVEESWEEPTGEFISFGRKYAKRAGALQDLADEIKIGRRVLMDFAASFRDLVHEMTGLRKETTNSFENMGERYHVIFFVLFAVFVFVSAIGLFGFSVYLNIVPRAPSTFLYFLLFSSVLWAGVVYLVFRSKRQKAMVKQVERK